MIHASFPYAKNQLTSSDQKNPVSIIVSFSVRTSAF